MSTGSMNPQGSPPPQGLLPQHNQRISHLQSIRQKRRGEARNIQPPRKPHLHELLGEVRLNYELDDDIQDMFLQMADDFVDTTLAAACTFAKDGRAPIVELRDIQLHLERYWDMWIPCLGNDELRPAFNEARKKRKALIKKTFNK